MSVSLINRWSSRWEWRIRVSAHVDSLAHKVAVQEQTQLARGRFRRIMSENELLANMTAIAHGSIDYVLNEEGKFDIEKARRTGGIHILTRHEATRVIRHHKNGDWDEIETTRLAIDPPRRALELLGRHYGTWDDEMADPAETMSRLTGIPKHLLLARMEEPEVPGTLFGPEEEEEEERSEIAEVSDESQ